jgi:hypothetical protein
MVHQLNKAMLVVLAMAAVLSACAPASAVAEQNPGQVATSVAMTVQAQAGDIAAAVAATVGAQQSAATATESPTPIPLNLPDTPTPFVVTPVSVSGGSTGSTPALYACTFYEKKPLINVFKPGDPFDIVWVITNTGTKAWPANKDLRFVSGTALTATGSRELPALKPGDSATVSFDANAPKKPGLYGMTWKVEGGLCFPNTSIEVIRYPDP